MNSEVMFYDWFISVNNICSLNFIGLAYFVLPIIIYLCEVEGSTPEYVDNTRLLYDHYTGVCHNYGQDFYKCEMSGNLDGTCTETLTHSVCDCNGTSETSIITANYWV